MKRAFDFLISVLMLVILSPLLLLIAILVRMKLGAPVFFRQERPGRGGKSFVLIKFRSMTNTRDKDGNLASDEVRLTYFGKFLRATSIDELPELWNVMKGEMSLVGPRPLLMEYMSLYSPQQLRRYEVRPGITGWAQINGRNTLTWPQKFKLDLWYVENQSFKLDLKILILTVVKTLKREGISAQGEATMPKFKGETE